MNGEPALQRPIGWWLKEADARLEVVTTLASFDEPIVVEGVIEELRRTGLVEESDGVLRLTPAGGRQQAGLAGGVDRVRQQVSSALSEDEYVILVRLLSKLVAGLPQ